MSDHLHPTAPRPPTNLVEDHTELPDLDRDPLQLVEMPFETISIHTEMRDVATEHLLLATIVSAPSPQGLGEEDLQELSRVPMVVAAIPAIALPLAVLRTAQSSQ